MILISHRGNINGPEKLYENKPSRIIYVIEKGYNVEIDIWFKDDNFYLGHDIPEYKISQQWLQTNNQHLWVHCKNVEAIKQCEQLNLHYFWHENDTLTLTSKNYIWAYPGKQPIKDSIAVMPELYNDDTTQCIGICSDFIGNYK